MASTPTAIDWGVAASVAGRLAKRDPFSDLVPVASMQPEFEELTARAEALVAETTGLPRLAGAGRARVTDRRGWVDANLASFERLLRPLTDRFAERLRGGAFASVGRRVAGAEVGVLLGWMSARVLGQYDLLVVEDERPEDQDLLYYVGPNVYALERRFAFPPREFRLWIALHECTHRAQFTGVPWLRPHFLGLVESLLGSVDPDPGRFAAGLKAAAAEVRHGGRPLDRGGIAAVMATPEQRAVLDQLGGLMALLEGHGEVTMDRAGAGLVPSAERFGRVLRARRQSARGLAKLIQRLIGLDAKLAQYEKGASFISAVEAAGGEQLFAKVWEGPQWLPTLEEVHQPDRWIERARLGVAGPAGPDER